MPLQSIAGQVEAKLALDSMPNKLGALVAPRIELGARANPMVLDLGVLSAVFLISRLALYAAGLPFELELRWMFLSDTAELRDHLFQSFLYFHAYPPGMNLLTGLLLKLDAAHLLQLAHVVISTMELVLAGSLLYLARVCGLSRLGSLALAAVFCMLPQSIYLENLYIYSVPSAALLCLSAALFHRAVSQSTFARWFWFFTVCVVLCWFRSTFHLVWFVVMIALALFATQRRNRRQVLVAAAAPAALLLGLHLKNFVLFHVFGTTSWSGANVIAVTTKQLPDTEREELVAAGKLSPFANISVFAEPQYYEPYFRNRPRPDYTHYPGSDDLVRPTTNAANFNHWYFLEVNATRRDDASYYLRTHFGSYLDTVIHKSLPQVFHSTTHWHPFDGRDVAPHYRHRLLLGGYEALYDRVVHGFPAAPVGLYWFLPAFLAWAAARVWFLMRSGDSRAWTTALVLAFALFQIAYVTLVSGLVTYGESARYRYLAEAFIWLVVALACSHWVRWVRRAFRSRAQATTS